MLLLGLIMFVSALTLFSVAAKEIFIKAVDQFFSGRNL
jgi:hypothetical protein